MNVDLCVFFAHDNEPFLFSAFDVYREDNQQYPVQDYSGHQPLYV